MPKSDPPAYPLAKENLGGESPPAPRLHFKFSKVLRFVLWAGLLAPWTWALLVPIPQKTVQAVGGPSISFIISKTLHIGVYATLGFLTALLPVGRKWRILAALVASTALSGYTQKAFPLPTYREAVDKAIAAESLRATAGKTADPEVWLGLAYLAQVGSPARAELLDKAAKAKPEYAPVAAVLAIAMDRSDEKSVTALLQAVASRFGAASKTGPRVRGRER